MLKITFSIFLITFLQLNNFAQDDWTIFKKKENKSLENNQTTPDSAKQLNYSLPDGKVVINQSSEIDSLTSMIGKNPFINGYTVQIEVSQQQSVIKDARYKFLKRYPEVPLDDAYNAPNKYLYAGRFYDRNSAFEFKHEISDYFPNAIVIQKKMDLPPLPGEK